MVKSLRPLVFLSIIASVLTLFTAKIGVGELYPFTSWKLFTQPIGSTGNYSIAVLYGQTPTGTWQPLTLRASNLYDYDDAYYLYHDLSSSIMKDTSITLKTRLRDFATDQHPVYKRYEIRERQYTLALHTAQTPTYKERRICGF
ncbi:MAG TPA: hypothetical protein VL947_09975 [Cytophagales bacterium]|nr:hypothetical protein [Cytophagales bacterium]